MNILSKTTLLFFIFLLIGFAPAFGQMAGMEHDQTMKMKSDDSKDGHGDHTMGMEMPRWKKTLTEDQKVKAEKMHLELRKVMDLLEAKLRLKEAELNILVTQDKPDPTAVHNKITEIAELKRDILNKKYDHVLEMRLILTPDQRVSFDLGLMGHHEEHR